MHVTYGLPARRIDNRDEFLAPGAIGESAPPAYAAGFGAAVLAAVSGD